MISTWSQTFFVVSRLYVNFSKIFRRRLTGAFRGALLDIFYGSWNNTICGFILNILCSVKKSKQFWASCQCFWQLEIKKCNFQNFSNLKKLCYWSCQSAKIRSDNCKKSFQSFENLYVSLSIIIIFKKFPFCLQTASSSLHSADPSLLISTAANSLQM
jgi:hypothetical protein